MNYIKILQSQRTALDMAIGEARSEILGFKAHLHSAKFAGTEGDGSRKDWISTADVLARLEAIEKMLVAGQDAGIR